MSLRRIFTHKFKRTTLIVALLSGVLLGIGFAPFVGPLPLIVIIAPGILAILLLRRSTIVIMLLLAILGFSLGGLRGGHSQQRLHEYDALRNQKVAIIGTASGDGVYNDRSQTVVTLNNLRVSATGEPLIGTMYTTGFGAAAVYRGDEVEVTGKLREGFGQYQASMSYATMKIVKHDPSFVEQLRLRFVAGVHSALPEPVASFGLGLLIGQRSTLPKEVSHALLMVGLAHIIAVSGYNLTILMEAARKLFSRGSKFQTVLMSVSFIGVFLLFTGSSASIVRAALVSLLGLAAWYYGRRVRPLVLILTAAVITAVASPLYLWGDAGWYLSFLAFFGILVLAPRIRARLSKRWQNSLLAIIAVDTLCAEVMTIPFVLYMFGQMSFVGLLGNVLVAVCIPIAMLLTLVAGVAGMLVAPLAGWFAWPAKFLLTYMLDVAQLLSKVPGAFVEHIGLSLGGMLGLYAIVLGVLGLQISKNARKRATITDEKVEN